MRNTLYVTTREHKAVQHSPGSLYATCIYCGGHEEYGLFYCFTLPKGTCKPRKILNPKMERFLSDQGYIKGKDSLYNKPYGECFTLKQLWERIKDI